MKILLAYDGSPGANDAIDDLSRAGLPADVECMVVIVESANLLTTERAVPFLSPSALAQVRAVRSEEEGRAAEMVAAGVVKVRERFPGWRVEAGFREGSPTDELIDAAYDFEAHLVVIGARSHSALQRFFLGSTSFRVASEAPCSVRIARHHQATDTELRILVAVDGSNDSAAVIDAVARRRWPAQTHFHVATVADPKLATAGPSIFEEEWSPHANTLEKWRMDMLQHLTDKVRSANLDAECHVFDGEPTKRLLAHAETWRADAIFAGAHGLQHGERPALGTVAATLATGAHCTVEITRAPA